MAGLAQLRARTVRPEPDQLLRDLKAAKQGDSEAQLAVCGALVWAAFSAPATLGAIYDNQSRVYVGAEISEPSITGEEAPLPDSFWLQFETLIVGPEAGYDASSITAAVATLGGAVSPGFRELAESAARQHSGADNAASKDVPPLLELSQLSDAPEGSLGHALYRMLVDNGYDAEVLDRESIGLSNLPPAARYLNTRILQMHDVWHLVAGYQTTSLHEIAISSFQLAQFGHNYSGMFLATVCVMSQKNGTDAFNLMMQVIAESWVHGRQTPPLMAVAFETEWHNSIEEIRDRYKIPAFQGSFPPDLFEQIKASSPA